MAERKNIQEAIEEADQKLSDYLMARLTTEEYHEAIELSNIVVDLSIHAFSLAVDANREALGVNIDHEVTPKILEKLPSKGDLKGSDDCEEHA